jgi:Fe-S cluster biogenesis protein NfuA
VVREGFAEYMEKTTAENNAGQFSGENGEIAKKVKELIDTYVKPAVEMDGGNIEFKAYENGTVYVTMQGSCSGCPSSTVTLKAGIEGMLKRMVPEVTEVVQEMA